MKNLILFVWFLVLFGCKDLPFTNADIQETVSTKESKTVKQQKGKDSNSFQKENHPLPLLFADNQNVSVNTEEEKIETQVKRNNPSNESFSEEEIILTPENLNLEENNPPAESFSEEEITLISEDLNLTDNTVIQNRKVVLNMATIKTFEYDLFIIAEEFVSDHSVIQNFPERWQAEKKHDGKNGGNILVETEIAKGKLKLILNGENGGRVPRQRRTSKEERKSLKGSNGEKGHDAVYKVHCRNTVRPMNLVDMIHIPISIPERKCLEVCASPPTRGESGGDGLQGFPGPDGKNGGDSGSFYLKAFELSDFQLTNIQNNPGVGSEGGRGSQGGAGGRKGRNGRDRKKLCNKNFPRVKKGNTGIRGSHGKNGRDGNKGTICLERLIQNVEQATSQIEMRTACEENEMQENCPQSKENIICY